jgi:hypothetical protein
VAAHLADVKPCATTEKTVGTTCRVGTLHAPGTGLHGYRLRIGCVSPAYRLPAAARRRILLRPTGAPRWMSWFAGVARPRSRPRPCPNWISATHSGFMARVSEAHLSAFHELVRILNPCRRDCNPPDVLRLTITARHLPNHGFFCAVWGFSCPFWCPFCREGRNGDAASFSDSPSASTADLRGAACATIPDLRPAGFATLRSEAVKKLGQSASRPPIFQGLTVRAKITAVSRVRRKERPHGGGSMGLFPSKVSTAARPVPPNPSVHPHSPFPDDDRGRKRTEIRQRTPAYPKISKR